MQNTQYHSARLKHREINFQNNAPPNRFVFVLTNKCNLSCDFCFQHRKTLDGQLTADEWIRFSNSLPKGSHVTLTGGEPLIFREFGRVFHEINARHTTNIITNGTKFSQENIRMMASEPNFLTLSVSIDTIGNHNRKVSDVVYQQMLAHLDLLRMLRADLYGDRPTIDAKCVVTDDNANNLVSIFNHVFRDLKVDTLAFQFLKGSSLQHADRCFPFESIFFKPTPHIYNNSRLIFEQFESIRTILASDRLGNRRVYTHPQIYLFDEGAQNNTERFCEYLTTAQFSSEAHDRCYAPWESVHINANGDMFPCLAVKIGNVRQFVDIQEVYKGEPAVKFLDTIRDYGSVPACSRCGYLNPKGLCSKRI
jgi:radical SAM protein with 4Fe4S-binding SPASM domain